MVLLTSMTDLAAFLGSSLANRTLFKVTALNLTALSNGSLERLSRTALWDGSLERPPLMSGSLENGSI
jgi:hypothetical protein